MVHFRQCRVQLVDDRYWPVFCQPLLLPNSRANQCELARCHAIVIIQRHIRTGLSTEFVDRKPPRFYSCRTPRSGRNQDRSGCGNRATVAVCALFSGALCQSEHIPRHGFSRPPGAVDQPADLLGRLARKCCLAAPLADLRGDVFQQRASLTFERENLAHEFGSCRCITAHMTFKHGRLVFGIRSTRSGRADRS